MARQVRRFGEFQFHPETGELFRGAKRVDLQNQPARVLDLLTRRPGELVSRDELRGAIWGAGTHVDFERGLNFCIRRIRMALGDSTRSPLYLETLPRRGYRFVAPVTQGAVRTSSTRAGLARLTAAAFILGLVGGAALAEDYGRSSVHRRLVDWLHDHLLVAGERCPWSQS